MMTDIENTQNELKKVVDKSTKFENEILVCSNLEMLTIWFIYNSIYAFLAIKR